MVLPGNNVIDLKCEQIEPLRHETIFADSVGASPNLLYE